MWHILTNRVVQAMLHYSRLEQPTPTGFHVLQNIAVLDNLPVII